MHRAGRLSGLPTPAMVMMLLEPFFIWSNRMRKVKLQSTNASMLNWAWFHQFVVLGEELHAVIEYSDGTVDVVHATEIVFDGAPE